MPLLITLHSTPDREKRTIQDEDSVRDEYLKMRQYEQPGDLVTLPNGFQYRFVLSSKKHRIRLENSILVLEKPRSNPDRCAVFPMSFIGYQAAPISNTLLEEPLSLCSR